MKKIIKSAAVSALIFLATSASATNGATMIGYGAKSFGMGGTSIGVSHGAESALSNPAMITSVENNEVSFGGTIFMPDVSTTWKGSTTESASDLFMIPTISIANKVNDNFYFGIGMWGTGGLGVDYRSDASKMNMVTALQIMQFGVPLVYTTNSITVGFTPIMQYGSLDINYVSGANTISAGTSADLTPGYTLGFSYKIDDLTMGAVYKSEIEMEYGDILSKTMSPMVPGYSNNTLSTPSEMGFGVSYKMGESTIALDYKTIAWSSAAGFEDFGWEDQAIIALGYKYETKNWAVRAGYQNANSAVTQTGNTTLDTLNLLGFPATIESHVSFGGTYSINPKLSIDLAYVKSLEADETYTSMTAGTINTKHSQSAISFQINQTF